MANRDPDGPMQPPRKTRDVMAATAHAPRVSDKDDEPERQATDKATGAVERQQEGG